MAPEGDPWILPANHSSHEKAREVAGLVDVFGELLGFALERAQVDPETLATEGRAEAPCAAGVPHAQDEAGDLCVSVFARVERADVPGGESHGRMVRRDPLRLGSRLRGKRHRSNSLTSAFDSGAVVR